MATHMPVTENTLITIKVAVHDNTRKLKLPLKDLGADKLIPKLRHLLLIRPGQDVIFERYSDSVAGYVVLDPANPAVFKTLVRAAKAKLKLRLKATINSSPENQDEHATKNMAIDEQQEPAGYVVRDPGDPVIVPVRGSTAFNQLSVGPGIFKFREPSLSQKDIENVDNREADEAPVPRPFTTSSKDFFAELASHGREHELALRTKDVPRSSTWSVYCNECDDAMDNVHFHCSVCDGGDYDLCQSCVDGGKLCPGEGHWLIKRSILDGKIVNSTTERVAPKPRVQPATAHLVPVEIEKIEHVTTEREMPGTFTDDTRTLNNEPEGAFRTCNNCIVGLPDHDFVTCTSCDDFDLCRRCYAGDKHGHHPAHQFEPAIASAKLSLAEEALLQPGRNVRHNAICDGCDKTIYGIRHKCFACPDFDYCNECIRNARHTHPRHRFAPIYEPIALARGDASVIHHGIYCDGPLCKDAPCQAHIQGVRYKCVVCNDLDFCASCEALPGDFHNRTHPLIKFKTPVNNVTISTQNEDRHGKVKNLGDKRSADVSSPKPTANATTPVKTVADIKPSPKTAEQSKPEIATQRAATFPGFLDAKKSSSADPLDAHFVRDTIADGTTIAPNTRFTQVWTMRNPGPRAWPTGCSVRFVGGDNMLNVDNTRPSSVSDINEATESNIIGREVPSGEEVAFKVLLKTPAREGKSISYWRVKAADGTPFGHKLWCDVEVKKVDLETSKTSIPLDEQSGYQTNAAKYWSGYQERMAKMRLENAQRQAAHQQHYESRLAFVHEGAHQAQLDDAATYQAQADWRKQMEEFVRCTNASNMLQPAANNDGSKADMTVKANLAPSKAASEVTAQDKAEGELTDSQMIFPTLERESPSSSTYQSLSSTVPVSDWAAPVKSEAVDSKTASDSTAPDVEVHGTPMQGGEEEAFEDVSELEVLSADGKEESDDGFLTDEEYDILDASDQETVASK